MKQLFKHYDYIKHLCVFTIDRKEQGEVGPGQWQVFPLPSIDVHICIHWIEDVHEQRQDKRRKAGLLYEW